MGVMQNEVGHGYGQRGVVAEGVAPMRKQQIASQDHRATPFIAFGHDLEEVNSLFAGQL